jgi:xylulose-5-phosphate/fructose-6-phosphate phosphoketolase
VNLVVVDKQPHPQYLTLEEARRHAAAGASSWSWAGNEEPDGSRAVPDVVMACAGDIPTEETLAAAWLLQKHLPELTVRVVNIMDAMVLPPRDTHPHGLSAEKFEELFTADGEVIMAWHGYARALHQLLHGRPRPERFHVRGYNEQGTTTTPFDMVVLNKMSRYHLVVEALRRVHRQVTGAAELVDLCRRQLDAHARYIREHFEDLPEIRDWAWTPPRP